MTPDPFHFFRPRCGTLLLLAIRCGRQPIARHVRRPLTPEEAARLVEATAANPFVKGMTGPDRAMVYALAAGTGFRREELRTLTPERFNLDSDPPTVRVLAC